jgi:hypothetical protein
MSLAAAAPAVLPLVHRHAQDAAFYWQLLDSAASATGLGARRAQHFSRLQWSHLEGLELAGRTGLELSLQALQRWRKPGEAFAAFHTALLVGQANDQEAVLAEVARNPPLLLRAVVSALSSVADDMAKPWIAAALLPLMSARVAADRTVSSGTTEFSQVAALRACALRGWPGPAVALQHAHPAVRAAAARCRNLPLIVDT